MAKTRQVKQQGRTRGTVRSVRGNPNKWLVRVCIGTKMVDGKSVGQYVNKVVTGTFKQADAERTKMLAALDAKTFVAPQHQTVQQFVDSWLDGPGKSRVSSSTLVAYRQMMESHVYPHIGHRKLDALASSEVQQVYAAMTDAGLSPRLVRYTHTVLKMALKQAVGWQLIVRNPAEFVTLPKAVKPEFQVLTAQQVYLFLERTAGDGQNGVLWNVLLNTGLRPQEAFALTWSDVQDGKVSVNKALVSDGHGALSVGPTKTKSGRRTLTIPDGTKKALEAHKRAQAAAILEAGADYTRNNLVFANRDGGFLDIAKVRKAWKKALKSLKLPKLRLYDARHTHATLLLLAGVNVKAVSSRLGHATVTITLDTYAKWLPEMDVAAAAALEGLLQKASGSR